MVLHVKISPFDRLIARAHVVEDVLGQVGKQVVDRRNGLGGETEVLGGSGFVVGKIAAGQPSIDDLIEEVRVSALKAVGP